MSCRWLFYRVIAPSGLDSENVAKQMSDGLHDIAHYVHANDPDAHWSFRRLDDGVALDFHAPSPVIENLDTVVGTALADLDWRIVRTGPEGQSGGHASCHATELTRQLSTLSSDFALAMLTDGAPTTATRLPLALEHLRKVTDLVPETDRGAFLFCCWQYWTSEMTPSQRVALEHAAATVETPERATGRGWTPAQDAAWRRYLDALRLVTVDPDTARAPTNYLLFEHAHLTHNRLGIAPDVEAVAARLLRSLPSHDEPAASPASTALASTR